jgi:hypothetical protein
VIVGNAYVEDRHGVVHVRACLLTRIVHGDPVDRICSINPRLD